MTTFNPPGWADIDWAAVFSDVLVVDQADLPEHVDGHWRCGRCKAPMFGTGRCLACWPDVGGSS